MRQITFELLRHGPPHNQLLSPLTHYLALCENHAAVTVNVPFEHNQFLHRIKALSYALSEEARAFQVKDTARVLGDLLGQVPGLIAELNRDPQEAARPNGPWGRRESDRITHLRVILSASELALLPFELALTPNGFPGAGQPLLLQPQEPICLTREVRRVAEQYLHWPRSPRVLFVAASPADMPSVPTDVHLKILRRILEPWVGYAETEAEREARMAEHLVVLREATAEAIERECATGLYSHIHILAHGVQYSEGFDVRFGVALHNPMDPTSHDAVSGERLASMLRPAQAPTGGALTRPVAVTIASCNSDSMGGVAGVGASIAHALHAAGIPMVVASQFPVSKAASSIFVDVLYSSLLWGEDPRASLNDLRRRLHVRFSETHDWASLTAYLALPPDFEQRLSQIRVDQAMRSMEVAMSYADHATARLMKSKSGSTVMPGSSPPDGDRMMELLENAKARMETGRTRLEKLLDRARDGRARSQQARLCGLLASTQKRCAEVYFSFRRTTRGASASEMREWLALLHQARKHYWEAFLSDRDSSWAVVQYLSLDLVLRNLRQPTPDLVIERHEEHNDPKSLWSLAHIASINEIRSKDDQRVRWALGNLTELFLLGLLIPGLKAPPGAATFEERAVQRAQDLVDLSGPDSFEVYSTRRQILRYDDWYQEIANIQAVVPALAEALAVLPSSGRREWDED